MDIGAGGSAGRSETLHKVDVNTDDIQKVVLSTKEDTAQEQKDVAKPKEKEDVKTPVRQIIGGEDQSAKKELLKDFIQKVAGQGFEVFASPDKGKKDTQAMSEVRLLFGDEESKDDAVSISAEAKMGGLQKAIAGKKSKKTDGISEEIAEDEAEAEAAAEEDLKDFLFTSHTSAREKMKESQAQGEIMDAEEEGDLEEVELDLGDVIEELEEEEEEDTEIEEEGDGDMDETSDDNDFDDEGYLVSRNDREDGERGDKRGKDDEEKFRIEEVEEEEVEEDGEESEEDEMDEILNKKGEEGNGVFKRKDISGIRKRDFGQLITDDDDILDALEDKSLQSEEDVITIRQQEASKVRETDLKEEEGVALDEGDAETDEAEETDEESEIDDLEEDHEEDSDIEKAAGGRIRTDTAEGDAEDDGGDESDGKTEKAEGKAKVEELRLTKNESLEKYTDDYRKYLLSGKKDYFDLRKNEDILQKEHGITSRQLKEIQTTVKKHIKMEVRDKVKDAILYKQLVSGNKFEALTADTKLNKFTDFFVSNILMGGQDFGNFDESFQGLVNKSMYYAGKDLANFAIEELEDFVLTESIDPNRDRTEKIANFEAKINELNSITNNPKITEEWAQAAMEGFMSNYGLTKESIDLHRNDGVGIQVNVNTGEGGFSQGQDQERKKHGYEFEENDEKDILVNRLRALYMQRALNPGIKTTLDTEFKIRKQKNGLLKLGVFTDILNEQIKKEAEGIAKEKIMEMLTEALQERASMYELQGPAYSLVENKIKGIIKNGERLGIKLDKTEFEKIRDEINFKMFEVTKKEMEMLGVRLSEEEFPALVLKHREMKKLLERLKEESEIKEAIGGNEAFLNITIAETA